MPRASEIHKECTIYVIVGEDRNLLFSKPWESYVTILKSKIKRN